MLMNRNLLLSLTIVASSVFVSCSSDDIEASSAGPVASPTLSSEVNESLFPVEEKAKLVSTNGAQALNALLSSKEFKMDNAKTLHNSNITDEEWNELKAYVDKNLKGETESATYQKIFKWCVDSLKYTYDDAALEPYEVFKKRRCVCQGYANLCKAMLLTQNIPAFGANGMLGTVGAHAWLYAYVDGKWRVSDPTNNQWFNMSEVSKYSNKLLVTRSEIELFEDDQFAYNYNEKRLNVCRVKAGQNESLTVPFAVAGFKISSFVLDQALPENVHQIYFGSNIQSLGAEGDPLFGKDTYVEEAFVAPKNTMLSSENGVIYRGKSTTPYYIPTGVRRLVLRPMIVIGKNTVYEKPQLEEVVISDGTTTIEDYAFEACPALKRVYVPESVVSISENAFYRCPADIEIVRTSTSIHPVIY